MSVVEAPRSVAAPRTSIAAPLRVVRPGERTAAARRRRTQVLALLMVGVVIVGLFGLVAMHVVLAQEQFKLDRLQAKATEAQATYDQLRVQVAQLESPERIVADAEHRLGMVQPPAVSYLTPSTPSPTTQNPQPQSTLQGETAWSVVKRQLAGHP